MSEHYDRKGNPISMDEWATRLSQEKRIAETTLPDGKLVSTVWLGLNHRFGEGPPLIFETMVFASKEDFADLECERYTTEEEAIVGHQRIVEKWGKT